MNLTVLEALVIYTTGWAECQKEQFDEAYRVIHAARNEIERRLDSEKPQPTPVEWVPK